MSKFRYVISRIIESWVACTVIPIAPLAVTFIWAILGQRVGMLSLAIPVYLLIAVWIFFDALKELKKKSMDTIEAERAEVWKNLVKSI